MLQREYLHIPVYAWLAGIGALLLSVLYFSKHRSGSSAANANNPSQTATPTDPQNVYYSENVYNQPGANPGSTQVAPPPASPVRPPWWSKRPVLTATNGVPDGVQPVTASAGRGGIRDIPPILGGVRNIPAVNGGAFLYPSPPPSPWRPAMNSSIFGPPTDGTSPVAPVTVWNMTPTAAYTQA